MKLPISLRILRAVGNTLMLIGTIAAMPGQLLIVIGAVLRGPGEPAP